MTRIHQAAEECTVLINKNQSEKLLNFLRSLDYELKLNIIEDQKGYNLLHMAAFSNRTKCIQVLLSKAQSDLRPAELKKWVNAKATEDMYAALHFAAFKGNIQICQMLVENGADIHT